MEADKFKEKIKLRKATFVEIPNGLEKAYTTGLNDLGEELMRRFSAEYESESATPVMRAGLLRAITILKEYGC